MRKEFGGYYSPSESDYERLWKKALIVLDTNVLLNLYRLPAAARDEFLTALEKLKAQLWIPFQVGLEFQRSRLGVISGERQRTNAVLTNASDAAASMESCIKELQLEKRGLGLEGGPLVKDLHGVREKLIEAIGAVHKSLPLVEQEDPIRDRLDRILEDRIGPAPGTQAELDELVKNGEDRYQKEIPPGFADAAKDKSPRTARYVFDGLDYERKFGDLIVWRQVIEQARKSPGTAVLLVTGDSKEDWWWREQGKTLGPRPELVREIAREAGVGDFWMYSSDQFVQHANKYAATAVSEKSVAEIKQIAEATGNQLTDSAHSIGEVMPLDEELARMTSKGSAVQSHSLDSIVADWLRRIDGGAISATHSFPDLVSRRSGEAHGYEVRFVRQFEQMLFSPLVMNSILRGYLETKEGRLSSFTLVIVIREETFYSILERERSGELQKRIRRLLSRYPIDAIVVGAVIKGGFEPLSMVRRTGDADYLEFSEDHEGD